MTTNVKRRRKRTVREVLSLFTKLVAWLVTLIVLWTCYIMFPVFLFISVYHYATWNWHRLIADLVIVLVSFIILIKIGGD